MHQSQGISSNSAALAPMNMSELAMFMPTMRERTDLVHLGRPARRDERKLRPVRWGGLLPWQAKRVREYIDTDLQDRLSISVAACHARLSPGYFSRCFRSSFGVTFSRFVAQRRVELAQRLMIEGTGKLCQIALACGFADQAHFTRTFGAITGSTPARWRRQAAVVRLPA